MLEAILLLDYWIGLTPQHQHLLRKPGQVLSKEKQNKKVEEGGKLTARPAAAPAPMNSRRSASL